MMRGPGMRIDFDMRRIWRCPACGSERRAEGKITSLRCNCSSGPTMMKLIEPQRWRPPEQRPADPYMEFEVEEAAPEPPPKEDPGRKEISEEPTSPAELSGEATAETAVADAATAQATPTEAPSEDAEHSQSGGTPQPDRGKPNRKKRRGRSRRGRGRGRGTTTNQ